MAGLILGIGKGKGGGDTYKRVKRGRGGRKKRQNGLIPALVLSVAM